MVAAASGGCRDLGLYPQEVSRGSRFLDSPWVAYPDTCDDAHVVCKRILAGEALDVLDDAHWPEHGFKTVARRRISRREDMLYDAVQPDRKHSLDEFVPYDLYVQIRGVPRSTGCVMRYTSWGILDDPLPWVGQSAYSRHYVDMARDLERVHNSVQLRVKAALPQVPQ